MSEACELRDDLAEHRKIENAEKEAEKERQTNPFSEEFARCRDLVRHAEQAIGRLNVDGSGRVNVEDAVRRGVNPLRVQQEIRQAYNHAKHLMALDNIASPSGFYINNDIEQRFALVRLARMSSIPLHLRSDSHQERSEWQQHSWLNPQSQREANVADLAMWRNPWESQLRFRPLWKG